MFVSGGSTDWYRPVYPGDTLYSYQGLESVEEKQSEFAERSVIQVHRTVKVNQRGEVVAILRLLAIYTERKTARDRGKYAQIEPAVYTDADIAEIDAVYAAERPRGARPALLGGRARRRGAPEDGQGAAHRDRDHLVPLGRLRLRAVRAVGLEDRYKNRQRIPKFYVKNEYGVPDVAQRVHWDSSWAQRSATRWPTTTGSCARRG